MRLNCVLSWQRGYYLKVLFGFSGNPFFGDGMPEEDLYAIYMCTADKEPTQKVHSIFP